MGLTALSCLSAPPHHSSGAGGFFCIVYRGPSTCKQTLLRKPQKYCRATRLPDRLKCRSLVREKSPSYLTGYPSRRRADSDSRPSLVLACSVRSSSSRLIQRQVNAIRGDCVYPPTYKRNISNKCRVRQTDGWHPCPSSPRIQGLINPCKARDCAVGRAVRNICDRQVALIADDFNGDGKTDIATANQLREERVGQEQWELRKARGLSISRATSTETMWGAAFCCRFGSFGSGLGPDASEE